MFDHVTIRVADREASERFYLTVLASLGIDQTYSGEHFAEWHDFSLASAAERSPVTTGLHVGFRAVSRDHPERFWRDPDGNSVEAVHDGGPRGTIDRLRIRFADLVVATRFYESIGPHAGIQAEEVLPESTSFTGGPGAGSLTLVVADEPTRYVHLAFPAVANETVDAFHAAALAAGYRDNGRPGERSVYHEGYYGAFVLDPDGNNVEVVNHNR